LKTNRKQYRKLDVLVIGENASVYVGVPSTLRTIQAPRLPSHPILDREVALSRLNRLAAGKAKCIAICGSPAMGKTTLASVFSWMSTKRFRDGVLWCRLGPHATKSSASRELARVAGCLGVAASTIKKADSVSKLSALVSDAVGMRHLLIVVDDVWDAKLADYFRIGGPNSCVMITTRRQSVAEEFAGSKVVRVDHLQPVAARRLLRDQLASVPNLDRFIDDLATITGGCPLSIVIACANFRRAHLRRPSSAIDLVRSFLSEARTRMALSVSTPGTLRPAYLPDDVPLSLKLALDQSWSILGDAEKLLLRTTMLFPPDPGSFSSRAIRFAATARTTTLHSLIENCLLVQEESGRLRVHQTIADFAFQRGELPAPVRARNLAYWAAFCGRFGKRTPHDLAYIAQEADNIDYLIRGALADSNTKHLITCLGTLTTLYEIRGNYRQASVLLQRSLDRVLATAGADATLILVGKLASVSEKAGNYRAAEALYKRAMTVPRASAAERSYIAQNYGVLASKIGRPEQCSRLLSQALRFARRAKDSTRITAVLKNIGAQAVRTGEFSKCHKALAEALRLSRHLPDRSRQAAILMNLGFLNLLEGKMTESRRALTQALRIENKYQHRDNICLLLIYLGLLELKLGNFDEARRILEQALRDSTASLPQRHSLGLAVLALCLLQQGDVRNARKQAKLALKKSENLGNCGFRRVRTPIPTQGERAFRAMPNTASG